MKKVVKTSAFLAMMSAASFSYSQHQNVVWLVPPAANSSQQGFVRATNLTSTSTTVSVVGVDDLGFRSPGTATFQLAPFETKPFNSSDLESGNPSKGLSGSLGIGSGNWRLHFESQGLIQVTALIRTPDGFLTNAHDPSPTKLQTSRFHEIQTFNPAENANQVSVLRLINPSNVGATIQIYAVDDLGARYPASGVSSFLLPAFRATQISSAELEGGKADIGMTPGVGNGSGKWRVFVSSDAEIKVMNLLYDPKGYLTELPAEALDSREFGYFYCSDFAGSMVYSQDGGSGQIVLENDAPIYLGYFGNTTDLNSINNLQGPYGSASSPASMRNLNGKYGATNSYVSWRLVNPYSLSSSAPVVIKDGKVVALITLDNSRPRAISLSAIDTCDFSTVTRRTEWQ